ncbi:MAG TPA: exodeoxyribonuclease V subunit gamma [Spirochaetota bacterium]|nr:exodeoxyribonuclease V subunit gamma [Spirochaetota bacterium]HSA13511.1 exodeoxyribonuclease V subunit gamma [Spirochaetota bacterium]
MAIKLYYSNSMKDLCAMLAGFAGKKSADPLDPVRVFVPNPYVRDWVQMNLARANGVAANIDYNLLDDGLWKIIRAARASQGSCPGIAGESEIRLLVYRELARNGAAYGPFASYLGGAGGADREKKAWQLAARLAGLFMSYEMRRQDMIAEWNAGRLIFGADMERAQRELYLAVLGKEGLCARMLGALTLAGHVRETDIAAAGLGLPGLHFFCESGLSPFHCGVIFELGRTADVYIYQVNPCAEFWDDMETAAEERWKKIKSVKIAENGEGEFLDPVTDENRLLQLWGRAGREDVRLMGLVEDASGSDADFEALWIGAGAPAGPGTVLGQLQRGVLSRTAPGAKLTQDTSLQVFRAPTVRREVEAAYASILANLESDPSLKMTDIALMVPDMQTYAPHIRSVFGRDPGRISYAMIDSTAAGESAVGAAVMSLLDLALGRFTRSEVFALVMNPVFQHARGIGAREADAWLSWAEKLNIFRGYSGGDADMEAFSWGRGLRKLRLGRIMEDPGSGVPRSYRGIAPYSDMDSSDRDMVGSVSETLELLHAMLDNIGEEARSGRAWREFFDLLIADFISVPADMRHEERVLQGLRESLDLLGLFDLAGRGKGQTGGLTLSFLREYIGDSLAAVPGFHGRYLVSGINISALVPRRNIPFRVCYVLGMGEGPFPGTADRSTLDLMALRRRIGDVSRPDANGYVFLQTLLSASDRVYLSYVSRDLQKDQDLEPNSLVSQLVTHIEESVTGCGFRVADVPLVPDDLSGLESDDAAGWQDVVSFTSGNRHHITCPSGLDRFMALRGLLARGASLDRAAMEKYASLERMLSPDIEPGPGAAHPDAIPGGRVRISLSDLRFFLEDPAGSRLSRHFGLGLSITADDPLLYDDEPLFSAYPDNYSLVSGALERYVLTGDEQAGAAWLEESYSRMSMTGRSPAGAFMQVDMETLARRVHDRIRGRDGRPGIGSYLARAQAGRFIRGISLGETDERYEMNMNPLCMTLREGEREMQVEITGALPFVWEHGDCCETLVMNGSDTLSPRRIIGPFLFYAAAATGLHEGLSSIAGKGAFCARIEMKKKFQAWTWKLSPGNARGYLERLVRDYLFDSSVYALPAGIVMHRSMGGVPAIEDHGSAELKSEYRNRFIRVLAGESESDFSSYAPGELVYMVDPSVPADAYDMARFRFGPIAAGETAALSGEDE